MIIKSIRVKDFRNYKEESLIFHEKVNLFTGNNGQGKTNLLEAVYILSMGKSFRTLRDEEMIRFGSDGFFVNGSFLKKERNLTVGMSLSKNEKTFFIDGAEKKKNADLLENVYAVVFSPEDLKIVKEEPDKRRKFIDRELFQIRPLYYKNLSKYKKVLKNRNVLLKEEYIQEELLDVYDEYLADAGARIIKERESFINQLAEVSKKIGEEITGGKESLSLRYEANIEPEATISETKEKIKGEFFQNRKIDIERRSTTAGPHKDDMKITLGDTDLRHFGSQGQQRTAALSLKLAELKIIKEETGENPILLLDDVLSELDPERQSYLINSFSENQIVITAADPEAAGRDTFPTGAAFTVAEGGISRHI